ncbi:MAG: 30S ribosomal protein S1 [Sutterella parvirubra]|uniref:30S ribosomal protein S1 n=1 Tax=Sutterella parvirubra YIT 11816 TaxID=762967 RepID=H3KCE3_9BURK|nr:30S ribosomal protein S1 [Sutterella parvirubra]EHY32213.1 ribosomal protein S1 [Sutterella parvirubra YIT 11816]MCI7708475.1 30S ribosomal protein S1 [Sutterella parvirubra]MDY5201047.1 30S ribosomal protein S1 [Sutterella parvirubra]
MSNEINKPESFAELFEQSLAQQEMRQGEVITAEVVRVDYNFVVVNAGLKSEAYVPIEEFKDDRGEVTVQPGDFVSVAIEAVENGYGDTILSRDKAKRLAAWMNLESALESGELVTGTVTGKVKGGLTVMTNGIRAFLPGSLVDTRPVKDTTPYEGNTYEFKVIKLDRKRNNVVVSRRAVVEANMGEERAKLLETLQEGAIVKGIVKNITDYGAFVDLGGIDGLLHITDLAWRRVRHPSEVVQVGQELEAKVLKFDREKNRVSLGLKQLGEDPWIGIARRYPQSTRLFGKVTNITDYGAFVEVEAGIEGLVHVSEMDWTNKNVDPRKVVTLGEEVEVMVLDIDEERRRISLGMKQCKANPWEEFAQSHKKGDKVSGQIKSITDFGVFIGLPGGIDGLVHLSDLSWNESGEDAVRKFKKGDELEAVVLAIDTDRERISLGIKQMGGDPFGNFASTHDKGTLVKGTVKSVDPKGAVIDLGDDVEGYLRASEISADRVEDATTRLSEGEEVEAVIVSMDRKNRSIQLSIKAKDAAEAREALDRLNADADAASGTTNLGALLKAKLEQK